MLIGRFPGACVLVLLLVLGCSAPATPSAQPASGPPDTGSGWRYIGDFPGQGASEVSSIIAVGGGFVAVGSVFSPDAQCLVDTYQGRVWTSANGAAWTAQPADVFAQTRPTRLFTFKHALYLFGVTGSNEGDENCTSAPGAPGLNLWRSTDGGVTWQSQPPVPTLENAALAEVITISDAVIAIGSVLGTEEDHAGTWTSADATTWIASAQPPNTPALGTGAGRGAVVVGFGNDDEFPLAWISRDAGANWYEESIDLEGVTAEDVSIFVESALATDSGYVAVGDGCCIGAAGMVPIVYTSADGTQWIGRTQAGEHAEAMRRVLAIPGGLLAVGVETFVTDTPDMSRLGGRSWVSADGSTWRRGPDFAELGDGDVTAAAAGISGVVVAGASSVVSDNPAAGGDTGLRLWFGSYGAFDAAASN